MFDDWTTTVSTNATPPRTLTEFAEEMRRLKELIPQPEFDCIVCLPRHMEQLKKEFPQTSDFRWDALAGLPVYMEETRADAVARTLDLQSKGKRPLLVCDPKDPPSPSGELRLPETGFLIRGPL